MIKLALLRMKRISKNKRVLGVFGSVVMLLLIGLGSFTYGKVSNNDTAVSITPSGTPTPTVGPTLTPEPTINSKRKPTKTPTPTPLPSETPTPSLIPTETPLPFSVTNLEVTIDPPGFSGSCGNGKQITFTAHITTNNKGTVSYKWKRSDGGVTSTPQVVNFVSAGTQTVSTSWNISSSVKDAWEQIDIISPNSTSSPKAVFNLTCI